jgi:competence protein ComGC
MSDLKGKLAQKIEKVQEKEAEAVQTMNETEVETMEVDKDKIMKLVPIEANDVVPEFAITITEAKQRTKMLQKFVKDMMIADIRDLHNFSDFKV